MNESKMISRCKKHSQIFLLELVSYEILPELVVVVVEIVEVDAVVEDESD